MCFQKALIVFTDTPSPIGQVAPPPPEGLYAEPLNDSCIRLMWNKVNKSFNVMHYHISFREVDLDDTEEVTRLVAVFYHKDNMLKLPSVAVPRLVVMSRACQAGYF